MPDQRFADIWTTAHSIHDAGLLGCTIELTCPVRRHVRGFDPYALWWLFEQRGWDDRLTSLLKRFHCVPCRITSKRKVRPTVRVTNNAPTDDTLRRPDQLMWKKSVKRRRT